MKDAQINEGKVKNKKKLIITITVIIAVLLTIVSIIGVTIGGVALYCKVNFNFDSRMDVKEFGDGVTNEYKFIIPSENYPLRIGDICFRDEKYDNNIDALKTDLEKNGYAVTKSIDDKDKECLIIGLYTDIGLANMFVVGDTGNGKDYYFRRCCSHFHECRFPWPPNLKKFSDGTATFQDYVDFYNSAYTEVLKVDEENQRLVIRGVDPKIGNSFNALIEIQYYISKGKPTIKATRISSIEP